MAEPEADTGSNTEEYRCPMCGSPIEVEISEDDEGRRVYRCLSRTEDCKGRWQCPLNEDLTEKLE